MLMQASNRWTGWMGVITCLVIAWVAFGERSAFAFQEAPPAQPAASADPGIAAPVTDSPRVTRDTEPFLTWMIRASGIFGFVILITAFVMVALVVLQMLQLQKDNYIPAAFVEDFERLLNEKNYQGAYEAAKANSSFIAKVLAAGLSRLPRSYDDALQGMEETGELETLEMEQSIGYLALIASVAPMLGLLGTVQGMISSFQVLSTSVVAPRSSQLADGIATALFTTLEGLVVAIPALICFNLFRNRLARFVLEAGFISEELMKRFRTVGKPAPLAATTAPTGRTSAATASDPAIR